MHSKANNKAYEDGWDRIFGQKQSKSQIKRVAAQTADRRTKYEEKPDMTMRTTAKRRK